MSVVADLAAMETAAKHVETVNSQIQSEIGRVRDIVAGSQGNWEGTAAAAFVRIMADYDAKATQLNNVLAEIAVQIRENGRGYDAQEQANLAALNAAGASGDLGTPASSLNI
ncbi:WXG100 family type VII secretion target [Nocardia carnea]|uniref:WXG100 family type VII secretion target n=1 Tax=Nocardia carnea TaxID=37328 RepID=UPI0024583205|nr:WXG100 family type VII secretion target [Nocardia carnea]